MRRWLRNVVGIVALSSLGAVCDAFYAVSGRVEACDTHAPIADAEVRVDVPTINRKGKTASGDDGEFTVAVNYPPGDEPSVLSVKKPGYAEARKQVGDPKVRQTVCLQRLRTAP
jgi:hypothetical protein